MLSVQTNMLAMNAARQFKINTKKKEKNTEKLASGYKINRAADDAAGLSMSETMRRMVRGLQKGSENITEGISLIKVADAALGEITDMLQRINELSVQAYNGTNTKQDRMFIQEEVDQLLEEIGRTGETTVYNDIQVLKWESSYEKEVQITADRIYTRPVTIKDEVKYLPDWLHQKIDDKLETHAYASLGTQDTSGIMVTAERDSSGNIVRKADGSIKYVYYGPNNGNNYGYFHADYAGPWTADLADNATAKVSFEGLKQFTNFSDLYGALTGLLGGGFGISCGTCRAYEYGLAFTGEVDGICVDSVSPYGNGRRTPELDLSEWKAFQDNAGNKVDCFTWIKSELARMTNDGATEAEQSARAGELADEIAKKLCEKAYELMNGDLELKDHYTKSFQSGAYDIIVYDYRDNKALTYEHGTDTTVRKYAQAEMTYQAEYLESGTRGMIEIPHDLYIVCSAQDSDDISIKLPYVSLEKLGIENYSVGRYVKKEEYREAYK